MIHFMRYGFTKILNLLIQWIAACEQVTTPPSVMKDISYIRFVEIYKPNNERFGLEPSGKTAIVGSAYALIKTLGDGESVVMSEFEDANFEKIKEGALSKINSKTKGDRKPKKERRQKEPESEDDQSVASGGGARFSKEDCKTFHTQIGKKLVSFLRKQGEGSAEQLACVSMCQEKVSQIEKVAVAMESDGVSSEIQVEFASLIITLLEYMKKEMISLRWNAKSAVVLDLDELIDQVNVLKKKNES